MGPSRLTKRFGWKRFAIGAGVLIGLVWAFGPRYSSDSPDDSQREHIHIAIELGLPRCSWLHPPQPD